MNNYIFDLLKEKSYEIQEYLDDTFTLVTRKVFNLKLFYKLIMNQNELNQIAFDTPQRGDFWHEMFCPYFAVVEVLDDDKYIICDKFISHSESYEVDYSQCKEVDKSYFDRVLYKNSSGFCASVIRNKEYLFKKAEYKKLEYKETKPENISMWDYFAAHALSGSAQDRTSSPEWIVKKACMIADEMMKNRNKKNLS